MAPVVGRCGGRWGVGGRLCCRPVFVCVTVVPFGGRATFRVVVVGGGVLGGSRLRPSASRCLA